MKNILLIFSLLILTLNAELPPHVYENYQKNAPEALMIKVLKVDTSLIAFTERSVVVEAQILSVEHSKSQLKRNDVITIHYSTVFWRPSGWAGPSSIPVLKEEKMYRSFLKKSKNNTYVPAAKGKSFQ